MKVFVSGSEGYVGNLLVPELLKEHKVVSYDLCIYGIHLKPHSNLLQIVGDIRDSDLLINCSSDCDIMIHLASTGAPSDDISEDLTKSINYLATANIVSACRINNIKRLIVAGSTSQYGVKPLSMSVNEDVLKEPVDTYGVYKEKSEKFILNSDLGDTEVVFVRPSTLCGYSPRLRLDLAINILTISALVNGVIKVFGGEQMRPTLNINDMVRFYKLMLIAPKGKINRKAFNVMYQNKTIMELAELVKSIVGGKIEVFPNNDRRSYHVDATRMKTELGFECKYTLEDGIRSIIAAYNNKMIPNALTDSIYYNDKRINEIGLK